MSASNRLDHLDCQGALQLVGGLGQYLQMWLDEHAMHIRRARAPGAEPAVPRVAELLAAPAFHPLDQWLRQRQVNVAELQAGVDQLLEQVRQAALNQL